MQEIQAQQTAALVLGLCRLTFILRYQAQNIMLKLDKIGYRQVFELLLKNLDGCKLARVYHGVYHFERWIQVPEKS